MKHSIDINGVLEEFRALSGEETLDGPGEVLCRAEAYSLCCLLRDDCDCVREMPRLVYAAACNAYYRRLLLDMASDAETFKASDVSVTRGKEPLNAAKELADGAMKAIADLLVSRRFAFVGVAG